METPDRDDDPVESWEYEGHQCHVYAADDDVDGDTVWSGYAKTRLPEGESPEQLDVHVPGDLVTGVDDGWVGFAVGDDSRDAGETKGDVEDLVDQLVELETSMDG
ncbi:hypothetical protein HWV07_19420 [Natronomonas salina]|uniref:hypothetical protein n=1 Tax=Natronomonas salina TaxID=1710540 RepID=UPI0015B5D325|nr:hypothetical protein [Natronomonas salina]QLD91096.1 hypothetical protein HWV07_19420 [Natronomonas salina]